MSTFFLRKISQSAPLIIDRIHSIGILFTVFYFSSKILTIKKGTFDTNLNEGKKTAPLSNIIESNKEILIKLENAIEGDKIYQQEGLSLSDLAKHIGVQEYILRKYINSGLGYRNFNDYINEIRIERAKDMLLDQTFASLPIVRIAMDLGFGSIAPFNKAFKERTNMTPSEFRLKRK